VAGADTLVLLRALQYAATFGYTVWLRPQDAWLGKGVAASGAVATRLGLSGVPVVAETIALHTLFELVRATGVRACTCAGSPAPRAWRCCARPRPRACR
jgi:dihydroorotase